MKSKGVRENSRRSRPGRFVSIAVALSLMTAMGSVALAETNAAAARSVAEESASLHWANATAGSTAVARAALHQALHFRVDAILGYASEEDAETAVTEAGNALLSATQWTQSAPPRYETLAASVTSTLDAGEGALSLVIAGEVEQADRVLHDVFEPGYDGAIGLLEALQGSIADEIAAAQSLSADVERLTRLFVGLLIPAAAIVISQLILRRRHREDRLTMAASLEAERELNRAKDRFIASFSHELRTPLTGIYGFADYLVEQRLRDPQEALDVVKIIRSDASELSRMVEDILVAARLESGEMSFDDGVVDLVALAHRERELLANEGHHIQVHAVPSYAWATDKHVTQIVRNIVSNAVRYGGGKIDIVVGHAGEYATIAVSDSGPGVPEEVRERMFNRFVNEGDDTLLKGSVGLGLNVAKALAAAMGGTIQYERKLGWTNFILALPMAPVGQKDAVGAAGVSDDDPTANDTVYPPVPESPHPTPEVIDDMAALADELVVFEPHA